MKTTLFIAAAVTLMVSNIALANGLSDLTCAGYIPTRGVGIGLSKASVTINFMPSSEKGSSQFLITKRSDRDLGGKAIALDIDGKDCAVKSTPDADLPAYRMTVNGSCGTNEVQDIVAICFFN